jgi:hypothetical protein
MSILLEFIYKCCVVFKWTDVENVIFIMEVNDKTRGFLIVYCIPMDTDKTRGFLIV